MENFIHFPNPSSKIKMSSLYKFKSTSQLHTDHAYIAKLFDLKSFCAVTYRVPHL